MNSCDVIPHASNDSDWLAVRFVLGELTEAEAAAFEQQLATDQAARDALVAATRLVETLAAMPAPAVRPARRSATLRIVAALTVIAAGMCVAIVGYRALVPSAPDIAEQKPSRAVDPARIAALWLDSANSLNGIPEFEVADDFSAADPQSALLPPDWLLAAVEQEEAAIPSDEPAFDVNPDAIERN